jgi:predicted nucleotide-binding protein
MVMLDDLSSVSIEPSSGDSPEEATEDIQKETTGTPAEGQTKETNIAPKSIFIAHGKNRKPLDQLIEILKGFNVPYKVAVNEPNSGRPIPQKVKDLMSECGSAIFIFSKEGEDTTESGETIPNLNVVFELGASSVLYGEKVVIFKEGGLKFSSDFDSLGYIPFETNKLDAQAMNLFKELISMGFLKVVAA